MRAALLAVALLLVVAPAASAADRVVTTTADGDDNVCNAHCTLREAVNESAAADRVLLLPLTYTLTQGPLELSNDAIVGAGARSTTIDGANTSKIVIAAGGTSTITGVTLTRGNGAELQQQAIGGAVTVRGASAATSLTITDSAIVANTGIVGGGIAVRTGGTLNLINSTVANNVSTGITGSHGGGIFQDGGVLNITNSTISGNVARDTPTGFGGADGGGIYATAGTLALQSSTLSNNRASTDDGLFREPAGSAAVGVTNTIVHSVPERSACGGNVAVFVGDHNLSDDSSCGFTEPTDKLADARLGALANNGGPTDTHALGAGSAAIDSGAACPAIDQRGVVRSGCDIGAFEYRAPTLTVVTSVANAQGGTAAPADFAVHVRSGGADVAGSPAAGSAGTGYTLAPGTFQVSVDALRGYTFAFGGACGPDGTVALAEGQTATCTVVADDPSPTLNRTVNGTPKSGTVRVKLPGRNRFRVLREGEQLPNGTVVDTTRGRITLTVAAPNGKVSKADFYDGIFKFKQAKGLTTLTLVEQLTCPRPGKASAAAGKKKRRLWGDGKGRFRTKGKHSAATVVGTKWLVEDTCRTTLTRVVRGRVSVRDFVKKKTVLVRAGKRYTARARR